MPKVTFYKFYYNFLRIKINFCIKYFTDLSFRIKGKREIMEKSSLNNMSSFHGILQVFYKDFWYNVSNYGIGRHEIRIICKYFNFENGVADLHTTYEDGQSFIFSINCPMSVSLLNDCLIENFMETWLDEIVGLNVRCLKNFTECEISKNERFTTFYFLNSCYYVYEKGKMVSYLESEQLCKKNGKMLLGISTQNEARFIENILINMKFHNSTQSFDKLKKFRTNWKVPVGL